MTETEVLGRRDRKKQETRAALASAALRLAAERGVGGVTVEDISEAADVSVRTFFNYFPSKEDAIAGRNPAMADRMAAVLRSGLPGRTAFAAARHALLAEVPAITAAQEDWALRMQVIERNPELVPRIVAINGEAEQQLVAAIGERTGLDPERSAYPALVAAALGAVVRVSLSRWARGSGEPLDRLVDEAFDCLAAGLPEPG